VPKTPRKKKTTAPFRFSVELEPANAKHLRKEAKRVGSVKRVLDDAVKHVRECQK